MGANPNVSLTLDDAVAEVLGLLTGLDLTYDPRFDRYRATTRALNRALRANALENEWSCYASTEDIGEVIPGVTEYALRSSVRPRIIGDDAVRLVDADGVARIWAYFLPRDADHKYSERPGVWATVTRSSLRLTRPITTPGLRIQVPVMREPKMFELPRPASGPEAPPAEELPDHVRDQLLDFDYPDVVCARAAYFIAQSDPVLQPRVQTLEADYKNLMYALVERDVRHTDSPYVNDYTVPIASDIFGTDSSNWWGDQPHSDGRR